MSSSAASTKTLSIHSSLLSDRSVIAVSGEDAREFLQGLITNDIRKVTPDTAVFTALLTPQGKFLFDFFIIEHAGKLLLDIDKSQGADLIKRLTMYKLRSKVEIASMPELQAAAEWANEWQVVSNKWQGNIVFRDPRLPGLGARIIGKNLALENNDAYEKHRLSLGIPAGGIDLESGNAFPMQWGYDRLNAIDFNKGCYVGQEVTARSKHIGTMRKMVYKVLADTALPPHNTPVMAQEKEIGQMASSTGNIGLALLNIEAAESASAINSNGVNVKVHLPEWVSIP